MTQLVRQQEQLKSAYDAEQADVIAQAAEVARTYAHVLEAGSDLIAELDCLCSLAHVAAVRDWARPKILPAGSRELTLTHLRHPCVEAGLGAAYVPSSIHLSGGAHVAIITGPNMGGKSTFIRAVGISLLLAHIGSFVPASQACIPVLDRLMARVGASDSMERGVSTFMAEMQDTSAILSRATPNSCVIIDELGRGTSTHEGFGIAWAVLQRLAETTGCLVLFATHFHELTSMQESNPGIVNLHVAAVVSEDDRDVTMLYEVQPGACEKSYGIQVAQIAGFPSSIVEDAHAIAASLELHVQRPQSENDGHIDVPCMRGSCDHVS